MKPTDRDLIVARAAVKAAFDDVKALAPEDVDLAAVIADIPEPEAVIIDDCPWTPAQLAKGLRDAVESKNHVVVTKSGALRIAGLLESLPESAPLPAPTGPGWYWARRGHGVGWTMIWVEDFDGRLYPSGSNRIADFDAWVGPLAEPEMKHD